MTDVPREDLRDHPDTLTGADVFDAPDESLSPTDPVRLVPWLRALPIGTILLDKYGDAWQVRNLGLHPRISCVAGQKGYYLGNDHGMREMAEWAPYRIAWTSGGMMAQ